MPEKEPNIIANMLRIHRIITRGLEVAIENGESYAQRDFPNKETASGFLIYVNTLTWILHAHHLSEDELAFPKLGPLVPELPLQLLIENHRDIKNELEKVKSASAELETEKPTVAVWAKLNKSLNSIRAIWLPHIGIEEEHFTVDKFNSLITSDDHRRLGAQIAEHTMKNSGPDYLAVPFLLFNLAPDDRVAYSQMMPEVVIHQLVPIVWKDKWQPMLPFLLP